MNIMFKTALNVPSFTTLLKSRKLLINGHLVFMLTGLSHKKLLMQTEELIEQQLNDAQKRLTDVHRVSLFL